MKILREPATESREAFGVRRIPALFFSALRQTLREIKYTFSREPDLVHCGDVKMFRRGRHK